MHNIPYTMWDISAINKSNNHLSIKNYYYGLGVFHHGNQLRLKEPQRIRLAKISAAICLLWVAIQ